MKIGVIVNNMQVAQWQINALNSLNNDTEIVIYNCLNSKGSKRRIRHALYYILNLFTVRNPLTAAVSISDVRLNSLAKRDFHSEWEGAWQRLPAQLIEDIRSDAPAVLLKFGLNLLRVPPPEQLAVPILSYHHGDPEQYRGRPAGFWELLHGRRTMGQIVQILSNRLDAGAVVASAETKVYPHSYRATLMDAYRASPLILGPAIKAAASGKVLPQRTLGPNYRLPGNFTVMRFCARLAGATARRLQYGALWEKRWQVSTAAANAEILNEPAASLPPSGEWRTLACPNGYTFIADPFFAPEGDAILVEALHAGSGKGELFRIDANGAGRSLTRADVHFSYPAAVEDSGSHYIVPETVDWSTPLAYRWEEAGWPEPQPLLIDGEPRLLDPTFLRHGGALYLFGNRHDEGSGVLRLWRSASGSVFGRFEEHPASPIRISPAGSRMAGEILQAGDRLLRLGQDDSGSYGDGLMAFAIEQVDADRYRETLTRTIRFEDVRGPHTLNFRGGTALFDWYRDRFSLLAGVRRLRGRLQSPSRLGVVSAPSSGQDA
jgi:hypothetical protein